jgi:hypothetical protein
MISKIALALPPPPRPTGAPRPASPALSASAAAVAKPPSKGAIIGGDGRSPYKAAGRRVVSRAALPLPRSNARISAIGRCGDDADPVPTAAATAFDPTSEARSSY